MQLEVFLLGVILYFVEKYVLIKIYTNLINKNIDKIGAILIYLVSIFIVCFIGVCIIKKAIKIQCFPLTIAIVFVSIMLRIVDNKITLQKES